MVDKSHDLYSSDTYWEMHSSMFGEDADWKVRKLIAFLHDFDIAAFGNPITELDIGGGSGIILKELSAHLLDKGVKSKKNALDISPLALRAQQQNNPDMERIFCEDINKTSLKDKEIDLVLMIDVLEHIPQPTQALKELKRISKYVIFKVPLEHNFWYEITDLIQRGKFRKNNIEIVGHINKYDLNSLKSQIEKHCGKIIKLEFTNYPQYAQIRAHSLQMGIRQKLPYLVASYIFRVSPRLCSFVFLDFALLLVKCYQ